MTSNFWLQEDEGVFLKDQRYVSASRLYLHRHNGFFLPDGLIIEFQAVEVDQPGPKGWDPTNVVRYSAVGDVLWEIQKESAGNGYREIRACPGGFLEATSRDGLRKYWLKATTGQVFSKEIYPDPTQVLSDEDRCTWSVTGNQVFYQGELRFEHPERRVWSAYPVDDDLILLWQSSLTNYPEKGCTYDPRNIARIRPDGMKLWLIQNEPITSTTLPGAGCGFYYIGSGLSGDIEVQSSNFYDIYRLDPATGGLTYLRTEPVR